jgi:muramidase (phage lysozyme)
MFAVGRYQITHDTLMDAVRHMHLTGNERLTPELQDRIFAEFLVRRRAPLARFIFNGVGSVDDAQYAAAQEWASVAVPRHYRTKHGRLSDGSMTYYDGDHANRASSRATRAVRSFLTNLRR